MQKDRLITIGWSLVWGTAGVELLLQVLDSEFLRLPHGLVWWGGMYFFMAMIATGVYMAAWERSRRADGGSGWSKRGILLTALAMIGTYLVLKVCQIYIAFFTATM